ncbi:AraC family transcriptional regulator [Bordetella sp. N]|uniref:AraC family transcriptional regulator n=1 Tax=Bordetella sp. N TaxID=1746199 RepID=UPI000710E542|nr:AraC family transcriptional regulator [Bordetella sp. N]ALM85982.1 AraC family transcriptional regulator [Bordetella sp. N]
MQEPDDVDRDRRKETEAIRTRLAARVSEFVGDNEERRSALPSLSFAKVLEPTAPSAYVYEPSISLIVRGRKRVRLGSETYVYDASRFLLTAVNLPTVTQVLEATPDEPYISMLIRLDLREVRLTIADIATRSGWKAATGSAMATGPASIELFGAVERLVEMLHIPDDLAHLGRLIEKEIIYRVLRGPAGARLWNIAMTGTQSHKAAAAVSWLRENFTCPLSVERLAGLAEMGVSTLHHHFRAMTAMSPLQFQKQLRLHEARRLLLGEDIDAATAATRVGYESVTQFNREYRRLFGAPPIRDVAPLRSPKPSKA